MAQRLTDRRPKWVTFGQWSEQAPPLYIGLSFDCPCPACETKPKRLACLFWPPVDPEGAIARYGLFLPDNGRHRRVSGETFDTLTLSPSLGFDPHWHGHITAGEIIP